jgi:hypothetical protein
MKDLQHDKYSLPRDLTEYRSLRTHQRQTKKKTSSLRISMEIQL